MWWVLVACIDYTIKSQSSPEVAEDTASVENELEDFFLLDDTGVEVEDTAEEDIVEEMVADAESMLILDQLYEINPETGCKFTSEIRVCGETVEGLRI